MKIDLHVHTKYSIDSLIEPRELVKKSRALRIIPAVADHNSIEAHKSMRALRADFIPAEEIYTDKGDLIGLYLGEPIAKGTPFLEAIDKIHAQGGLAYLPHMFDYGRSKAHAGEKEAAKADIIEVFNARCLKKEYNERAEEFAKKHGLPGAAGSDSHFLFEFGHTYTEVPFFDIDDPKALMKALITPRFETHSTELKTLYPKLVGRSAPFYVRGTTTFIAVGRKLRKKLPF